MIALDNLTVSYRRHPALHHVTGRFDTGSLTAVVGPNGAGKSTLLKSLLGLLPREGEVHIGCDRRRIGYLPQQADIDRSFPLTVMDCVLLGFWQGAGLFGGISATQRRQAAQALQAVGLQGFATRPVGSLSAGQFQRVLFARLVVQDAELILLDEPFTAVDSTTTAALLGVVTQWHRQGRTVIAVVHDDEQVRRAFPQCLMLAREVVAWGETAEVMTTAHLRQAQVLAGQWEAAADEAGAPWPVCELPAPGWSAA